MMQNGVGQFVRERHPVATDTNFRAITNASLAGDRYNTFRKFCFGVNAV
jgi:hypothetical protein